MKRLLILALACPAFLRAEPTILADLTPKLGSENFAVREEALKQIKKLVADESRKKASLQWIKKLWLNEKKPEIRARLFSVGVELYTQKEGSLFGFRFFQRPPIVVNGIKTITISVSEVIAGSPAEKAGLKANDLIYGANKLFLGTQKSLDDILAFFKLLDPGETHALRVRRGNEDLVIKVKPDSQQLTPEDRKLLGKSFLRWLLEPWENAG